MTAMTHGRTELTIELRTPNAFATVFADRTTFDGGQLIAWQDGAAIASYPVDAIAGLRFGGSSSIANVDAVSDAGTHQIAPTAVPSTDIEPATTSPAGAGWTPGEDALLRTLSDQDAGLTMMILKTQRPMDEVIARLTELGIAATRR